MAFRIARDVVIDALRAACQRLGRTYKGRGHIRGAVTDSREFPGPGLGGSVEPDKECVARLGRALSKLDPVDSRLIALRQDGASWGQVAQSTCLTTSAVQKRWERLRRRLGSEMLSSGTA